MEYCLVKYTSNNEFFKSRLNHPRFTRFTVVLFALMSFGCGYTWASIISSSPAFFVAVEGETKSAINTVHATKRNWDRFTVLHFAKVSLAGGLCVSIINGALCPVDVVKTRMQLNPRAYSHGIIDGFRTVITNEGFGALATGLHATIIGSFVQGEKVNYFYHTFKSKNPSHRCF